MLTVHHLGISQSERVVWLCEELEIPYALKLYERDPDTGKAPPAYRALHPFGLAPVITDGAFVLGESGAVIEYIIAIYGQGRLAVTKENPCFADYLYWYHFANATLQPSAITAFVIQSLGQGGNAKVAALLERFHHSYDIVEQSIADRRYFAGPEFTAADIMMVFNLTTLRKLIPHALTNYSNIRAYLSRIGERPGYRRAMRKAEPDMPLLLE